MKNLLFFYTNHGFLYGSICLKCSQLPIGDWLFRIVEFVGYLRVKTQLCGIVKPFHRIFIVTHTNSTDITRRNEFLHSYHVRFSKNQIVVRLLGIRFNASIINSITKDAPYIPLFLYFCITFESDSHIYGNYNYRIAETTRKRRPYRI